QMVILVVGELAFAVEPALGGHVGLAADDRLDAGGGGLLVELDGAEQVAVVGDGHGRHAEGLRFLDQGVNLVGPVEETILSMNVEVDELGRHAGFLLVEASFLSATPFYRRTELKSIGGIQVVEGLERAHLLVAEIDQKQAVVLDEAGPLEPAARRTDKEDGLA